MNDLSINRVCTNTYNSFTNRCKEIFPALKFYLPPLFAAAFFKGLGQQVLLAPTSTVVYYASTACEIAAWGMTAKAAYSIYQHVMKKDEPPAINYEMENNRLRDQCNYLHKQLQYKNNLLNLEPDHRVILPDHYRVQF